MLNIFDIIIDSRQMLFTDIFQRFSYKDLFFILSLIFVINYSILSTDSSKIFPEINNINDCLQHNLDNFQI